MNKINVLLVTGIVTKEHRFERDNEYVRQILRSTGRFEVKITEEFRGATARTLENYDMVLVNYDGRFWPADPAVLWGKETEQALYDFVKSGKGICFFHSSVCTDPEWPDEYWKLIGGRSLLINGGRRNPNGDFTVKNRAPGHPIMKDVKESFSVVGDDLLAGIEFHPDCRPEILATVFDDLEEYKKVNWPPAHLPVHIPNGNLAELAGMNADTPVAWTHKYGDGRVFTITIGHEVDTFRRVDFMTMLVNGCEYAATGEVTIGAPDRSGDKRLIDWPYYS